MAPNREKPHLFIVPEDKANSDVVNAFFRELECRGANPRQYQIVPPSGGWGEARRLLREEYLNSLMASALVHVLLIVDFDNDDPVQRRRYILDGIDESASGRVFVVGAADNPEALRADVKMKFQLIGETLANECFDDEIELWNHCQLSHNVSENQRLKTKLYEILFQQMAKSFS